ncbi:uncharacterized protein RJT21DRAFT_47853 [Scheffersomyces amazonensis]|uniref:uncharacterized protein n=1 Tax=Scheffersomyces amazonensis TaxID=1078765 RepID=UPI00315DB2EB
MVLKPIYSYLYSSSIKSSTKLVTEKLRNEPDHNYFNSPTEKKKFNDELKRLMEKLPKPVDEESKLEINRRKLAFKICHFYVIVPENTILDEDYIVSKHYVDDLSMAIEFVHDEAMHSFPEEVENENKSVKESIKLCIKRLLSLSHSLSLPIPKLINSTNKRDLEIDTSVPSPTSYRQSSRNPKLASSNYTSRSIFHSHLNIRAISDETKFADDALKTMFDKLIIDKAALESMKPIVFRIPRIDDDIPLNELDISVYISSYILDTIACILDKKFKSQLWINPKVIADFGIRIKKDNHDFQVPFEIKTKGIFAAYQNRNNQLKDTAFHELINEAIYNCLYCKSHIGFVIDMDCVLVVEIDVGDSTRMGRVDSIDGGEYQLPCNIRCLRFSDSKYNLTIILMMLIKDYFDNVNTHKEDQVERLFDTLRLTSQDIVDMKKWQHDFVYLEWASKFSHYHKIENGDYAHNIYSYIIIPKECYEEVHHIKYDVEDLNEADFNTNCPEFCFETYTYFQVDRLDGTMVLKVYNPYVVSERLLCDRQFLESYSIALRSFLYEVRAYRIIAEAPKISGKNGIVENYNSHLYRSGIINWPAIDERYFGFYLLTGYAKHNPYNLKAHNLSMEAQTTLKDVHHNNDCHAEFSCKEANSVASNWPMGE